ncbi:unnamed protein product [Ceutorhynchus assimilis]|uniref:F-box domain-containing protein n=1 Tax=Ceutorhynchus assimilis TaxID=467358 RepID=A0A9N9QT85_9CUCU|nr:unnamed protein product [Ceutorhynchus assimilis]
MAYFTRAKRRKLSESNLEEDDNDYDEPPRSYKRKNPFMFVPTEVIQLIFEHISYNELSTRVRLVNRRFKVIAETCLNIAFRNIGTKLDDLIKITDTSLSHTQDDMIIKCIAKLLWILKILKQQHMVIFATIWRYVYNDYYKTNQSCMYGGLIIDIHEAVFRKFDQCPNDLYSPSVIKDHALPSEVSEVIFLTKTFCVHFDKVTEELSPNPRVLSGCKTLDILDCANFAQTNRIRLERRSDTLYAKYTFYFKNSWFCAIHIPPTKTVDWPQKQRLMHMRLRRIVLAHNDMYLQQAEYEKELELRPETSTIRRPPNNVYTGYGDVERTFFYYGVMNEAAYVSKFHSEDDIMVDELDEEEDIIEVDMNQLIPEAVGIDEINDLVAVNSEEDVYYRIPYLGLKIDVSLKCPVQYAPLKYLNSLQEDEREQIKKHNNIEGATEIVLNFESLGNHYARLACTYNYKFMGKPETRESHQNTGD